jgi:hypothetical protein
MPWLLWCAILFLTTVCDRISQWANGTVYLAPQCGGLLYILSTLPSALSVYYGHSFSANGTLGLGESSTQADA